MRSKDEAESMASGSTVATGVTADSTGPIVAAEDSDCSKEDVVLGVSARTDKLLLTTVNAERPNSKVTSLKEILFTVTPQESHQKLKKRNLLAHFLGFWFPGN
ncbi:MAG TPA: hypothetical protein V6D14_24615 [Coleofasciculaceae cyanobacterium]|jgi:hypothetical protein